MWSNPRQDTFEVYYIPSGQTVNGTEIRLDSVTGGTINMEYYSDTKLSGSIDFADFEQGKQEVLKNAHIRIYYLPVIAGKVQKYEICTGYITSTKITITNNGVTGQIEFAGELLRFTADKLINTWTIKKGTNTIEYFKAFNAVMGNSVYKYINMPSLNYKWDSIVDIGQPPKEVLTRLEIYTGCETVDDSHGRIVMQKYIAPGNKPVVFTYPTGEKSIIFGDIEIEDTANGTPNRYVVYHTYDDNGTQKMLRGVAQLPDGNPLSAKNQNRWITEVEQVDKLEPRTQAKINSLAQTNLKKATQTSVKYTFKSFFAPFRYGDVIRFTLGNKTIDAIVESMTIDIVPGATMQVTAREIRKS